MIHILQRINIGQKGMSSHVNGHSYPLKDELKKTRMKQGCLLGKGGENPMMERRSGKAC